MGFEIRSRKWKQKDKFAHEKWGKFMETKTGLRSSTDRSWVVLAQDRCKTREVFRCSCVYFATQYNVHYDNRQAGHLLSALRLERCTAAIIFPHNKMSQKNHWIAWQCTFKIFDSSSFQNFLEILKICPQMFPFIATTIDLCLQTQKNQTSQGSLDAIMPCGKISQSG